MERAKTYIILHLVLLLYSLSTVFSKLAAGQTFFSPKFILYYAAVIMLLGIYALVWQRVIKKLPLTVAYANKAVTVIWGIVWGALLFSEKITMGKIVGGAFVIVGVIMYSAAGKEGQEDGK